MAHAHLIDSLGFELAFDSEEQALQRQERVGNFARGRALQIIESVFDTMSRPGQLLRLDRLELDLGPVDDQDLEAELERRLREQLELALRGVWAQMVEVADVNLPTPSPASAGEGVRGVASPAQAAEGVRRVRMDAQVGDVNHPTPSPASAGEGRGEGPQPRQWHAASQGAQNPNTPSPQPSPADAGEGVRGATSPAEAGEGANTAQVQTDTQAGLQAVLAYLQHGHLPWHASRQLAAHPVELLLGLLQADPAAGRAALQGLPAGSAAWRRLLLQSTPAQQQALARLLANHVPPTVPRATPDPVPAQARAYWQALVEAGLRSGALAGTEDAWRALLRHDRPWLVARLAAATRQARVRRALAQGLDAALLQDLAGLWVAPEAVAFITAFIAAVAGPADLHAPELWAHTLGHLGADPDLRQPLVFSAPAYVNSVLLRAARQRGWLANRLPAVSGTAGEAARQWLQAMALQTPSPSPSPASAGEGRGEGQQPGPPSAAVQRAKSERPSPQPSPAEAGEGVRGVASPAEAGEGAIHAARRRVLARLAPASTAAWDARDWAHLLRHDAAWLRATLQRLAAPSALRRRLAAGLDPALLQQVIGLWVGPPQQAFIAAFVPALAELAGQDAPALWADVLGQLWLEVASAPQDPDAYVPGMMAALARRHGIEPALPAKAAEHQDAPDDMPGWRRRLLASLRSAGPLDPREWEGLLRHDPGWLRATLHRLGQDAAVRQHVAQGLGAALLHGLIGLWVAPARQAFIAAFVQGLQAWAQQRGGLASIDARQLGIGLWAGTLAHLWVERPGDERAYMDSVLGHLGAASELATAAARVAERIGAAAQPLPGAPARGEIRLWRRRLLASLRSAAPLDRRHWDGLLRHDPAWLRATLQRLGRSARMRRRVAQGLDAALLGELVGLWVAPARQAFMVALVRGLVLRAGLQAQAVWEQVLGEVWLAVGPDGETVGEAVGEALGGDRALAGRVLQRLLPGAEAGLVDEVLGTADAPGVAGRQQLSAAVASRRFDAGFEGLWFELADTDALWLRAWLCGGWGTGEHPVRDELVFPTVLSLSKEALVPLAPTLRQAQGERGEAEGEHRAIPHPVRAELVEALVPLAPTLRQAQGERGEMEGEHRAIPHPVRAELVEALVPLAPTLRQAQGERGEVEGEHRAIPHPARAELVEAPAPLAPTLRQAQGEREAVAGEHRAIPHPVRAELVRAPVPLAPTLRQAQGEREAVEAESDAIHHPVRAELVGAPVPLAPTLRQAQGEREAVEAESDATPHPVRAEPVEALVPRAPTLRQAQGEREEAEGESRTTPHPARAEPVFPTVLSLSKEAPAPLAPPPRQAQDKRDEAEGESLAQLRRHIAQHLPHPRWLQSLAPWLPPTDHAALAAAIRQLAQSTPAPREHETRLWQQVLARLWRQPRQRLDLPSLLQIPAQNPTTPPLAALQAPTPLPPADAERWRAHWHALPAPARAAWREPLRLALETPPAATRLTELLPPPDLAEVLHLLRPDAHEAMQAAAALVIQACHAAHLAAPEQTEPLAWQFIFREAVEEDRPHHDPAHTTSFATRLVADLAQRLAPGRPHPQPQRWHQALAQALADGSPPSALRQSLAHALRTPSLPPPNSPAPPWQHTPSPPLDWDDLAEGDALHIANAGLVLAGPYLPRLLRMLGLADATAFTPPEAAERAVHLLQMVVDANPETAEPLLVLNKLLCGLPLAAPIPRGITPTPQETAAIDGMLQAMIQHWATLGNTSIAGLRETFLQREGRLLRKADAWHLVVQHSPLDVLLDRLPWGYATIKYPWMDEVLHVDWR